MSNNPAYTPDSNFDEVLQLKAQLQTEAEARQAAEDHLQDNLRRLNAVNQELEEATAALWDHSARLRTILNTIPVGVLVLKQDGRIEAVNRIIEDLIDVRETLCLGRPVHQHVKLPEGQDVITMAQNRSHCEGEAIKADGSSFPVEISAKFLAGVHHDSVVLVLRDLRAIKKAEAQRAELERELAQSQRLESLGTLAGGIAHEINTPIQYVGDNIQFLNDSFEDFKSLLDSYAELREAARTVPPLQKLVEVSASLANAIDLDFLEAEIPKAITEAKEGVSRVSEIVQAIKEFSHPGQKEKSEINLNQAIETTSVISRNQWKYIANLQMDFDPSLPPVPCHPGEINQVILNLLVNAADALAETKTEDNPGLITIETRQDGDWAEVRIKDNGLGVPAHIQERIFDPFFTTKDPGKGTGQGLAICHSIIVKKHGGSLHLDPLYQEGACFVIRLPLQSRDAPSAESSAP